MFEAIAILWFLAAATGVWGASLIIRGCLGERPTRKQRARGAKAKRSLALAGLGLGSCVGSLASAWFAFRVAEWASLSDDAGPIQGAASGMAVAAATMLVFWWLGDRGHDKRRCRRCWYDMSATEGLQCPECGREAPSEAGLHAARRRNGLFVAGVLIALVSAHLFGHAKSIARYGWFGAVPTTVLKWGWSWLPEQMIIGDSAAGVFNLPGPDPDLHDYFIWQGEGDLIDRFTHDPDLRPTTWVTSHVWTTLEHTTDLRTAIRVKALLRAAFFYTQASIAEAAPDRRALIVASINHILSGDDNRMQIASWLLEFVTEPGDNPEPISLSDDDFRTLMAAATTRDPAIYSTVLWLGSDAQKAAPYLADAIRSLDTNPAVSLIPPTVLGRIAATDATSRAIISELLTTADNPSIQGMALHAAMESFRHHTPQSDWVFPHLVTILEGKHAIALAPHVYALSEHIPDAMPILLDISWNRSQQRLRGYASLIPGYLSDDPLLDDDLLRFTSFYRDDNIQARQSVASLIGSAAYIVDADRRRRLLIASRDAVDRLSCDADAGVRQLIDEPRRLLQAFDSRDQNQVLDPTITFTFNHNTHTYTARIDRPNPYAFNDTGITILLLSGGLNTDLHWTVPAELTGTGSAHTDGDHITAALVNAGYSVLRYSSIFDGDPAHAADPTQVTPMTFEESVALARAAHAEFKSRYAWLPGSLVLMGHSLGATRAAALLADDRASEKDVAAVVWLAGAYTSNTAASPTALANDAVARNNPAARDIDEDGAIRPWERVHADRAAGLIDIDAANDTFRDNLHWPADIVLEAKVPTLALYGSLDPITLHAPWLHDRATKRALTNIDVRILHDVGHTLGPVDDAGTPGTISNEAIADVIEWLELRFAGATANP